MKFCIECAEQLESSAKFCSKCGAKQLESKITKDNKKWAKGKGIKAWMERIKEVYAKTPQNNCGECECVNCWNFAMKVASESHSTELDDCPYAPG
jgi:ArsR family metal-binding transcriptional regulator